MTAIRKRVPRTKNSFIFTIDVLKFMRAKETRRVSFKLVAARLVGQ